MQMFKYFIFILFICLLILPACKPNDINQNTKNNSELDDKSLKTYEDYMDSDLQKIKGISFTVNNYPRVDGSTSQHPLQVLIACRIFGVPYEWYKYPYDITMRIRPKIDADEYSESYEFMKTQLNSFVVDDIYAKGEYKALEFVKYLFKISKQSWLSSDYPKNEKVKYRITDEAQKILKNKKVNLSKIKTETSVRIPTSNRIDIKNFKTLNKMLVMIVRKHLNMDFYIEGDTVVICTRDETKNDKIPEYILENTVHFKTHGSYVNLIYNNTDLILVAREPSEDELKLAQECGVKLDCRAVAKDAFVFLVNKENPISNLTLEQIQEIYTGDLTNWDDVDGKDAEINPYFRNENSGSQELMKSIVMKNLKMIDRGWNSELLVGTMSGLINNLEEDENSISYSIYYYKEFMVPTENTKIIGVNGYLPNFQNIKTGKYPLTTMVYAVTRKGMDKKCSAIKLRDWMLTSEGQEVVKESGFVTIK